MRKTVKVRGEVLRCESFVSKNENQVWKGAIDDRDVINVIAVGDQAKPLLHVQEGERVELLAEGPSSEGVFFVVRVISPKKGSIPQPDNFIFLKDSPSLQKKQTHLVLEGKSICERPTGDGKWYREIRPVNEVVTYKGIKFYYIDYLQEVLGVSRVAEEFKKITQKTGPIAVDGKAVKAKVAELRKEADELAEIF